MYHSRIVLSVGGSVWYMIRNLRCTVTTDSVLANSKTQNAFLFTVNAIFLHDYTVAVEPGSTPRPLVQKKTWRDSLPIDMLLSAVCVLVVAQSSSENPVRLMNNPVYCVPDFLCNNLPESAFLDLLEPRRKQRKCCSSQLFWPSSQPSHFLSDLHVL